MRQGKNRLDTHIFSNVVFKPVFSTEIWTVISSMKTSQSYKKYLQIPPTTLQPVAFPEGGELKKKGA